MNVQCVLFGTEFCEEEHSMDEADYSRTPSVSPSKDAPSKDAGGEKGKPKSSVPAPTGPQDRMAATHPATTLLDRNAVFNHFRMPSHANTLDFWDEKDRLHGPVSKDIEDCTTITIRS